MKRKVMKKVVAIVLAGSMLLSFEVFADNNGKGIKNSSNVVTVEQESTTESDSMADCITREESTKDQEINASEETTSDYVLQTPIAADEVVSDSASESEWNLIWNDEFNGTELDTNKWSYQIGNGYNGWGNYEQQYYTKDNVTVSDGTLKITAKEESINGFKYTSSRIRTVTDDGKKLFTAKYGKFEARIKLPKGQGLWPAFWMMPADNKYGMWPLSGEIDIMEARGRVLDTVNGTIHFGESRPFNKSLGDSYTFPEGNDITGYHVYGVEWNENTIIWYVDGNEYYRTSNWYTKGADGLADYPAPFDQEFYLILNMAVGGTYDSYITPNSNDLPGTMEVDYVRVYQKKDGYSNSGITMPEGARDNEAIKNTPVFENGNLLSDINFNTINTKAVYDSELNYNSHNWFFINSKYFGGSATLSKDVIGNKTYASVHITDPGTQTYSVQLKQLLPLAKGYTYKVSFDAKSIGGNRTIKVKPVGGAARGYVNYNDSFTASLTDSVKNYEFTFMMKDETDLAAMIEFNLGKTMGDVMVGNVVVTLEDTYSLPVVKEEVTTEQPSKEVTSEKETTVTEETTEKVTDKVIEETTTEESTTEEETTKYVITEAIENGDFSEGLNVWNVFGTYYALEEKDGNVYGKIYTKPKTNPWDRMWLQSGIYLTKGETYTLTFKAKSSEEEQKFAVTVEDDTYNKSIYKEFVAGTQWNTYTYSFVPNTDSELTLKYLLGMVSTDCKLYLDDVKISLG